MLKNWADLLLVKQLMVRWCLNCYCLLTFQLHIIRTESESTKQYNQLYYHGRSPAIKVFMTEWKKRRTLNPRRIGPRMTQRMKSDQKKEKKWYVVIPYCILFFKLSYLRILPAFLRIKSKIRI